VSSRLAARHKPQGVIAETNGFSDYELALEMQRRYLQTGETQVGDPATGRIEPMGHPWARGEEVAATKAFVAKLHVPERRENVASPGEQGRRGRRASTSSRSSPDDPGESEPPPVALLDGFTAASERLLQRRQARMRLA
jgi:hypothetical protein